MKLVFLLLTLISFQIYADVQLPCDLRVAQDILSDGTLMQAKISDILETESKFENQNDLDEMQLISKKIRRINLKIYELAKEVCKKPETI